MWKGLGIGLLTVALVATMGFPWLEGNGVADGPDPATMGVIDSADPIGTYIIIDDGSPFMVEDADPIPRRQSRLHAAGRISR